MSSYVPALTPEAAVERASWQYRAISYLHGNKSQLGALLIAVMGRKVKPPCFHIGGMKIKFNDSIVALYDDGSGFKARCIYTSVADFVDTLRGLAEALHLTDDEKEAMFSEVRKFVIRDERVSSNLDGGINYRGGRN